MFMNSNKCSIFRTIFYNTPINVRDLSNLTNLAVSTVSKVVGELEEEKLIQIRVKGRNYLIYPNLENKLLRYYLLCGEIHHTLNIFQKYQNLINLNYKGKVVVIFGSYAEGTANELSDIDILTIDGNSRFNFSLSEFRKILKEKNRTMLSILKKHAIIKGFEIFVDEVIRWKKNSSGV